MKNELDISKIRMSEHAYERSIERLRLTDTHMVAVSRYIKKKLNKATFITKTTCTNGDTNLMYAVDGIAIYINPEKDRVVTVKVYDKSPYSSIYDKIKDMYINEIAAFDETEYNLLKHFRRRNLEVDIQIAKYKLKIYNSEIEIENTKSENCKSENENRILEFENRILELKNEIKNIKFEIKSVQTEKRRIANALVLFT